MKMAGMIRTVVNFLTTLVLVGLSLIVGFYTVAGAVCFFAEPKITTVIIICFGAAILYYILLPAVRNRLYGHPDGHPKNNEEVVNEIL